jgi:hypothetical protein
MVKELIIGNSSTLLVAGGQKSKNNNFLYRTAPEGTMMKIFASAKELIELLRSGGKYPSKDFILKVKGFNLVDSRRYDIFAVNTDDANSTIQKTLKVETKEDMLEFCKICKHSDWILKSDLKRKNIDYEMIQCVQFTFEIKDKEYTYFDSRSVIQSSTLNIVRISFDEQSSSHKLYAKFKFIFFSEILRK